MAKYKQGILGPFYGKVGNVVGSRWRGVNYLRSKPKKRKYRKPTQAQKEQRCRFALGSRFCYAMAEPLDIGFRNEINIMTPQNHALSYFMKNAIIGDYPRFQIDYAAVLISHGKLPNVGNPVAQVTGDTLSISWQDNSRNGIAKAQDPILIVVFHKPSGKCRFELGNVPRSAESTQLNIAEFSGKTIHVWISVTSPKGNEIANSIYLGKFTGTRAKRT